MPTCSGKKSLCGRLSDATATSLNGNPRESAHRIVWHVAQTGQGIRHLAGPTHGPSGYTLTELVVILGLLAVLLGLGGTWFASQLPSYRLNGVVRQIRTDLLAARAQAVRKGHNVRVLFTGPHQYEILHDANNNGKSDPGETVESRSILDDFQGVTIQSNNDPIFHPRGTATRLATVKVTNAAGEKRITISITGRVQIKAPA